MCYERAALCQAFLVTVYLNTESAKLAVSPFCIQSVRKWSYCWLQPKNRKEAVNSRADVVVTIYALGVCIQGHLSGSDRCSHMSDVSAAR